MTNKYSKADRTAILAESKPEPLVVSPKVAWQLLGCGNTHGYRLIADGELETYTDGRSRRITMASIRDYIARRIASAESASPPRSRRSTPHGNQRAQDDLAPRAS